MELPKRNASVYMASHFYLDDFPQSSEALSDQPMPHTHINPAEAFEADDQGYRGQPFPGPPRDMLRQRSFFSDSSSDFGGADPAQTLGSRLRESGISAAETAIAGIGLGARQYAEGAAIRGLGAGSSGWTERFAFRGRPRAWRRRPTASGAEAAAAAEAGAAGTGILATAGEAALGVAGAAGAAAGGLAVAGGGGRAGGHRVGHRGRPQRGQPPHGLRGRRRGRHRQRPEPEWCGGHPDAERHAGVGGAAALRDAPAAPAAGGDPNRLGQRLGAEGPAGAAGPRQGGEAAALALWPEPHPPAAPAGPVQRQRGLQDQPAEPRQPRAPGRGALVRPAEG